MPSVDFSVLRFAMESAFPLHKGHFAAWRQGTATAPNAGEIVQDAVERLSTTARSRLRAARGVHYVTGAIAERDAVVTAAVCGHCVPGAVAKGDSIAVGKRRATLGAHCVMGAIAEGDCVEAAHGGVHRIGRGDTVNASFDTSNPYNNIFNGFNTIALGDGRGDTVIAINSTEDTITLATVPATPWTPLAGRSYAAAPEGRRSP